MKVDNLNNKDQEMKNKSITQSQSSLGFFGIFRESFKTTSQNRKWLFPILLLVFLSNSQLELAQNYLKAPIVEDFLLPLTRSPKIFHLGQNIDSVTFRGAFDAMFEVLLFKHFTLPLSSIIKLFFLVATVSSSSEAYTSKVLGLKHFLLKIKTSWKNALLTSFCLILITLGIICIYMASYWVTNFLKINHSWSFVLSKAITYTTPVCYFYMLTLWMVSMVVSVLEEGCCGFKAIGRALELMNDKRLQALLIMVPFFIAGDFIFHMDYVQTGYNFSRRVDIGIQIYFKNGALCLLKLHMFVVYAIFYHDRKKSINSKKVKGLHLPVSN